MEPILQVRQLEVSFGGVRALRGIDLDITEGSVTALVGPNGAGKTTALDAITGYVRASGTVRLRGHEIQRLPAHARARRGLVRTWQGVQLFDDMTVRENLLVGVAGIGYRESWGSFRAKNRKRAVDTMLAKLDALGLDITDILDRNAGELSQGQRMEVGLCRSLVRGPQVLLADEPAAGLDIEGRQQIGHVLTNLAARGVTVVLVDHDMTLVMGVSHEIYVLDQGALIAHGTPAEIRTNERVIESYLGRRADSKDDKPGGDRTPGTRPYEASISEA